MSTSGQVPNKSDKVELQLVQRSLMLANANISKLATTFLFTF